MAKHRHPQNEPPSFVPATVEDLGAGERVRPALSIRRHAIVAAAVAGLTLAGATGWALTRPGSGSGDDGLSAGGPGAVTSPGALEGFGSVSPEVSASAVRPSPRTSVTQPPPSSATLPPSTEAATPTQSVAATVTGLEATYSMITWQGGYQVTLVVNNPTSVPVLWKLRIQLPANALFAHSWSAELARDGTFLTFTPPKWDNGNPRPLAPGTTHTFGFIALQPSGDYRLLSCTVDGVACRAVQP